MHHSLHSQLSTLARALETRRDPKQRSHQKTTEIDVMTSHDHLLKLSEVGNVQQLQLTPWQEKHCLPKEGPSFNSGLDADFSKHGPREVISQE